MDDATSLGFVNDGFEVALHVSSNCGNWTPATLATFYSQQIAQFHAERPSVPPLQTNRTHCIAWSDYVTQPKVELANGIRFDTNYYFYPPNWVQDRPGLFTGSAMPMRFADVDGTHDRRLPGDDADDRRVGADLSVHVGHAVRSRARPARLLRRVHRQHAHRSADRAAVGCGGELGDRARHPGGVGEADARLARRPQRLVVRVGRVQRRHADVHDQRRARIERAHGDGARQARGGALVGISRNGSPVSFTTQVIKGVTYAFFDGAAGSYKATYAVDVTPPVISGVTATPG